MKNELVKIAYKSTNGIIIEVNDLTDQQFYYGASLSDTYVLAEEISFIKDDELTNFVNGSYDSNVSDWLTDRGYDQVAVKYEYATQDLTDSFGKECGRDIDIDDEMFQGACVDVDIRSHMRVA